MGNGLHITGCKRAFEDRWEDADWRDLSACDFPLDDWRSHAAACGKAAEAWRLGETYMYQEPEPVDRWQEPTWWERFRARLRMWYRRLRRRMQP